MTKNIERLVETSYSNLTPSPQVEEELLDNLPSQRTRPRLAVPMAVAALILIGLSIFIGRGSGPATMAGAGDEAAPNLTVATVTRPKSGVAGKSAGAMEVRVVHGSGIQVQRDGEWTQVSLDELGKVIGKDPRQIVLRVDRDAPWLHVQWIMLICAEQSQPDIALIVKENSGSEYYLDASLPTDETMSGRNKSATVFVVPQNEQPTRWGTQVVAMPTGVKFKGGNQEASELATVARWLRDSRSANSRVGGEVRARPTTRFETVARLVAEFRQAGFRRVTFYGTPLPPKAIRAARVLPYPGGALRTSRQILEFDVIAGDRERLGRAEQIIRRRLIGAGIGGVGIERTKNGIRIALPAQTDQGLVRQLVERKGASLEMHILVEPDDPMFMANPRQRNKPGVGMRWYELSEHARKTFPKDRLPNPEQPLVLCRNDPYNITNASIASATAAGLPDGRGGGWTIVFRVKKAHQINMAALTQAQGSHLAIILDGKMHSAPILRDRLRSTAQIRGSFTEEEAKTLAALLQSEPLPVQFLLRRR